MKNNNLRHWLEFLTCFIWLRLKCQQTENTKPYFWTWSRSYETETERWNCEENAFEFSISRQPPRFKGMVHPPNARPVVSPYSQAKGAEAASFLLHKSQDEAPGQVKTPSCYSVPSSYLKWDIPSLFHQLKPAIHCMFQQQKLTLCVCNRAILVQCKKKIRAKSGVNVTAGHTEYGLCPRRAAHKYSTQTTHLWLDKSLKTNFFFKNKWSQKYWLLLVAFLQLPRYG